VPGSRYNVVLVQPKDYPYSQGLWDICRLLHYSLESLGYQSALKVNELDRQAINIIVGYHLTADAWAFQSHKIILYQLEQLGATDGILTPQRLEILRQAAEIWDYSPINIEFLKSRGVANVKLLPIGFHEKLCTIEKTQEDIDVLFYGVVNGRRETLLKHLGERCRLKILGGVYGQERDAIIARSKIVLNVHCYDAQIMEECRISYLLNNERFVICEDSRINPYEGMIVTGEYRELPNLCGKYLQDEAARRQMANNGLEMFRQRPMVENLRQILQ